MNYVINLTCETIINLLEKEVPKTILNYFINLYNQVLLSAVENSDDQVKIDIYSAFESSANEIEDCVYSEVNHAVSLTLASSLEIMNSDYKELVKDRDIDDLTVDLASLDV